MTSKLRDLERAIERALQPGRFIDYRASWDFVRELEEVAAQLRPLARGRQAADVVPLFETFIAGCYEKYEEVDDSSGSFGDFVHELFCDWTRARQAARASPEETVDRLLKWMENDGYGFGHRLEIHLVQVLNQRGLRAFAAAVRERLDASAPDDGGLGGYPRRRWTSALKSVLAAKKDDASYIALAEETGIGSEDCKVIAVILEGRGALEEAVAWVERGLALADQERFGASAEHDLKRLQRSILPRLGRADEALAAAWADYETSPDEYDYTKLMELVPDEERSAWHDKAMAAAEHGDLWSVARLFIAAGEIGRLAARIDAASDGDLERLSHYAGEPVSEALGPDYPGLAARVYRGLGMRILNRKKSKYYDAALVYFERARDCFAAAGDVAAWKAVVEEVTERHGRKYSFMPGFEEIVAGGSAAEEEAPFLERARARWLA